MEVLLACDIGLACEQVTNSTSPSLTAAHNQHTVMVDSRDTLEAVHPHRRDGTLPLHAVPLMDVRVYYTAFFGFFTCNT